MCSFPRSIGSTLLFGELCLCCRPSMVFPVSALKGRFQKNASVQYRCFPPRRFLTNNRVSDSNRPVLVNCSSAVRRRSFRNNCLYRILSVFAWVAGFAFMSFYFFSQVLLAVYYNPLPNLYTVLSMIIQIPPSSPVRQVSVSARCA